MPPVLRRVAPSTRPFRAIARCCSPASRRQAVTPIRSRAGPASPSPPRDLLPADRGSRPRCPLRPRSAAISFSQSLKPAAESGAFAITSAATPSSVTAASTTAAGAFARACSLQHAPGQVASLGGLVGGDDGRDQRVVRRSPAGAQRAGRRRALLHRAPEPAGVGRSPRCPRASAHRRRAPTLRVRRCPDVHPLLPLRSGRLATIAFGGPAEDFGLRPRRQRRRARAGLGRHGRRVRRRDVGDQRRRGGRHQAVALRRGRRAERSGRLGRRAATRLPGVTSGGLGTGGKTQASASADRRGDAAAREQAPPEAARARAASPSSRSASSRLPPASFPLTRSDRRGHV